MKISQKMLVRMYLEAKFKQSVKGPYHRKGRVEIVSKKCAFAHINPCHRLRMSNPSLSSRPPAQRRIQSASIQLEIGRAHV